MTRKRGFNLASRPDGEEPEYIRFAKAHLRKWVGEMNQGGGLPNVLAMVDRIRGLPQTGGWPISPGPLFSPAAERADIALRAVRELDPKLCALLMALAFDYSYQEIGDQSGVSKGEAQRELGPSWGAFAMALKIHMQLRKIVGGNPPRRAVEGDILWNSDTEMVADDLKRRRPKTVAADLGIDIDRST